MQEPEFENGKENIMEIKTLQDTHLDEILNAFNEAFSDYFVRIQMTKEQLIAKMKADKTNLELSVGVFDEQKLVGFILHGFDIIDGRKYIYNGGTGVIPNKRGSGLTKQMYQFILPALKKKEIDSIILEVISQNIQAIKSYEKSDFKIVRRLACFRGNLNISKTNSAIQISPLESYNWRELQSFWDVEPTWQNSKNTADELMTTNVSLAAYLKDQLVGYVIFNPQSKRIQQIAIHKDFRQKGIASTLIDNLAQDYGEDISIINIDQKANHILQFFNSIGLENYLEQLEMKLVLCEKN